MKIQKDFLFNAIFNILREREIADFVPMIKEMLGDILFLSDERYLPVKLCVTIGGLCSNRVTNFVKNFLNQLSVECIFFARADPLRFVFWKEMLF